jgi:hypothetical protein
MRRHLPSRSLHAVIWSAWYCGARLTALLRREDSSCHGVAAATAVDTAGLSALLPNSAEFSMKRLGR